MYLKLKQIIYLSLSLNLILACIDAVEVELWGECYNIEWTTHLYLPANQLTGEIPSEIGQLTNLVHLHLFNNQLTGEIPSEIGQLTNLENLQLFNNQLTGEIPSEIGQLTNLENLQLFNNQLNGEIPESIGNLINLNNLVLYNNQLTGEIPSDIGNLTNVNFLYLNDNELTGEIPFEICNIADPMPSLFNNQLCPPYPDCISQSNIDSFDTSECLSCEDGYLPDCNGDGDCCPESWIGDGWCDDGEQSTACNLICYEEEVSDCNECPDSIMGDTNYNGYVNISDIMIVINCILTNSCSICFDVNYDGNIDVIDIIGIVNIILNN